MLRSTAVAMARPPRLPRSFSSRTSVVMRHIGSWSLSTTNTPSKLRFNGHPVDSVCLAMAAQVVLRADMIGFNHFSALATARKLPNHGVACIVKMNCNN